MLIINQDKNRIIPMTKNGTLFTLPYFINGKARGVNLYYGDVYSPKLKYQSLLGSFNTALDALHEMQAIQSFAGFIYRVSGYSDDISAEENEIEMLVEGMD